MHSKRTRHILRPSAGFSLVEVTLALGICGFGLVTLLGLLPAGLTIARRAMDIEVQAQIIRQLSGVLGQTRYSDLSALDGKVYYFDDQGIELGMDKATQSVFRATLSVLTATGSGVPVPTGLPASASGGEVPSPRLTTAGVTITANRNAQNQVHRSIYVADRGW